MASLREIIWSLFGCYRLALRDPDALGFFNLSAPGFRASFTALLLAIPLLGVDFALDFKLLDAETSLTGFVFGRLVATLFSWVFYLGVVAVLDQFVLRTQKFGYFAIVYNWSQIGLMVIWLPFSILTMGLMGVGIGSLFALLFMAISYVLLWYILVRTLEISGTAAVILAFTEFVIALSVHQLFLWIFF